MIFPQKVGRGTSYVVGRMEVHSKPTLQTNAQSEVTELLFYQEQNASHGPMGPIQNTDDNYTHCECSFCFKARPL
jgi:hypothetical protein